MYAQNTHKDLNSTPVHANFSDFQKFDKQLFTINYLSTQKHTFTTL